ncbi:MAG: hypothetical protein ABIQ53_15115 [Terracoccus sp.]
MTSPIVRPPDLVFDGALLGSVAAAARRARDTLLDAAEARWRSESRATVSWAGGHRDRYDDAAIQLDAHSRAAVALLEALVVAVGRTGAAADDGAVRRRREQADWDAAAAIDPAAPVGAG